MTTSVIKVFSKTQEYLVGDIVPYWNNPRINDKTKEALIAVYEKIGFNQPIVIDSENVIVKGHARYYAAVMAGIKTIPGIITSNNEELNREDRILDNQIQELSNWDLVKLENLMRDIDIKIPHINEEIILPEIKEHVIPGMAPRVMAKKDAGIFFLICPVCGEEINISKEELINMEIVEDDY